MHQEEVDVVAAEMRVAARRQHLKDAVLDAEDRDVERPAAEVVDSDEPRVPLVESVRERRRGRLVDDPHHVEPGDAPRVARRRSLRVVEVRRNRDDGAIDFVVDLALLGEERFGAVLQIAQDERGYFRRRELARAEADSDDAPCIAANPERQQARFALHVVQALAHEPLHRIDGARRIGEEPALRFTADVDRALLGGRHDRRHQSVAAAVANDEGHAVLHVGDEAVRRAEVDADNLAHADISFSMPASRLLM